MIHIFKEIQVLRDEGKLHSKLINRTRMLFVISFIILLVVIYEIFTANINLPLAALLAIVGFFLGVFVFSQMNVVNWDEEKEILMSGKMDKLGYIALGAYILFEIGLRYFLKIYVPTSVLPLLLSGIFGTILGRAVGTMVEIHRVYRLNHTN